MATKFDKYRVVDENHPNYGKRFRGMATPDLQVIDTKTGDFYTISQVELMNDVHAAYGGVYFGRFGVFLFAREYLQYHSLQFGLAVDHIKHDDAYLDIELKIAVAGVGIRFTWLAKSNWDILKRRRK